MRAAEQVLFDPVALAARFDGWVADTRAARAVGTTPVFAVDRLGEYEGAMVLGHPQWDVRQAHWDAIAPVLCDGLELYKLSGSLNLRWDAPYLLSGPGALLAAWATSGSPETMACGLERFVASGYFDPNEVVAWRIPLRWEQTSPKALIKDIQACEPYPRGLAGAAEVARARARWTRAAGLIAVGALELCLDVHTLAEDVPHAGGGQWLSTARTATQALLGLGADPYRAQEGNRSFVQQLEDLTQDLTVAAQSAAMRRDVMLLQMVRSWSARQALNSSAGGTETRLQVR